MLVIQLDSGSGVPAYRQIIDQILGALAAGTLRSGDQVPTVRQLAQALKVNPNTVVRAYKELAIREILGTQQGTGTFVTQKKIKPNDTERQRRLRQFVTEIAARAGVEGFTIKELRERLKELQVER